MIDSSYMAISRLLNPRPDREPPLRDFRWQIAM